MALVVGVAWRPGAFTFPTVLVALACPAMMFFMMRGMHQHSGTGDHGHEHGHEHGGPTDDAEVVDK